MLRVCLTETDSGPIASFAEDKVIGELVRATGRFEESGVADAVELIRQVRKTVCLSTFVDIGANIGTHTLFALRAARFDRALCVEPDADNFRILRVNQILNGVDHRCTNVLAAASSDDGQASLELSPDNFGDHRVRVPLAAAAVSAHDEASRIVREVAARRVDSIIREEIGDDREIGLVWIDTQGHERQVLEGAPLLLRSGVPIVAEFWPYGIERAGGFAPLREIIAASGRQIYELRQSASTSTPASLTIEQLDQLYRSFLAGERPGHHPHTDIVLL